MLEIKGSVAVITGGASGIGFAIQNASMFLQLEKNKKSLEEDIWGYRSWF